MAVLVRLRPCFLLWWCRLLVLLIGLCSYQAVAMCISATAWFEKLHP